MLKLTISMKRGSTININRSTIVAGLLGIGMIVGCHDPLTRYEPLALDQEAIQSVRRQIKGASDGEAVEPAPAPSDLYEYLHGLDPNRIELLDERTGPEAYTTAPLEIGVGLNQEKSPVVRLSLEEAVDLAVQYNLQVQFAQLAPAISEAQIVQAASVFDAVLFTSFQYNEVDSPRQSRLINGLPIGTASRVSTTVDVQTGIRKTMETGGEITLSTGFNFVDNQTPGVELQPNPAWTPSVMFSLTQPLLRNFGAIVNHARILLAKNAHRRDVLELHLQLLETIANVKRTYWRLVQARGNLAIRQRLLELTIETRHDLRVRKGFDVGPIQIAQAFAFVELRRADVIRARQQVRRISDQLKALIHAPGLPVSSDVLIVPTDEPVTVPVSYSLLDAIITALQRRPEIRQALLNIDDASIRQAVADNQRLPVLNLTTQIQATALAESLGEAYVNLSEGDFISYLIGGQFQVPLGNRGAQAAYRQARLQRRASVIQYKQTVQNVVFQVKQALRNLRSSYKLIGVTRAARRAAAENLRALEVKEEAGAARTPQFLDLKLNTQQRLAQAQLAELQAIINYNIALINLYQNQGTLLERSQIEFVWPEGMFSEIDPEEFETLIEPEAFEAVDVLGSEEEVDAS